MSQPYSSTAIREYTDRVAAEYTEDIDYEDTWELAELIVNREDCPFSSEYVYHFYVHNDASIDPEDCEECEEEAE